MRLPLLTDISSRDGTSTKNARMYNVLERKTRSGSRFASVRPGLTEYASTTGSGKGLVCWNGTLVAMYGTTAKVVAEPTYTWAAETLPSASFWTAIAWNGTVFCTISNNTDKAATSTDGETWTPQTLPSSSTWSAIAWNGTVFCIVAGGTNKAATSPDGSAWTARTINSTRSWSGIAWSGTAFCACSDSGIGRSADGITWATKGAIGQYIAYGNGTFVTIYDSYTWTSTDDGLTWVENVDVMPGSHHDWGALTFANGVFVAVASNTSNRAAFSYDGINWTAATLPSSQSWSGVAYGSEIFCAISYASAAAAISYDDGATWVASTLPSSTGWRAIAYGGNVFSTVADGSTDDAATMNLNTIVSVGTVSGTFFDFAQSPT